ncbi:MAG TPA: ABC transporter permease [Candidatus Acidoferrales bacterium]|nr:ABC transporter permease [Candidatus Acidoferrales bacterium]
MRTQVKELEGTSQAGGRDAAVDTTPLLVIRPLKGLVPLQLAELWKHREVLYFLIWRDIKVRYKQTALGATWAIIQPLLTMLIFSIFFGRLAKVPSDGLPYPLFSYSALVPWTFFATGLTQASNSLVSSSNLITKVYFPRLLVPMASVFAGLMDLAIAGATLVFMMTYYHHGSTAHIVWVPALLLLALVTSVGVSFWFSAMNVKYRDIRHVLPFVVQLWMFATPIAYPSSLVPARLRVFYAINPMTGVIEGFRWALLGTKTAPGAMLAVSSVIAVFVLVSGAYFFRRMETTFADVV